MSMKKYGVFLVFVLLLFSVFGFSADVGGLKDLKTSHQFYDEISYLVNKEIISGYTDGTFKPDRAVTRGEAAIMIGRALKLDGKQRDTKFKDVTKDKQASGYITSAVNLGIITGYSNHTFKPDALISRGDMAIILSRAFDLYLESPFKFKDTGMNMVAYKAIHRLSRASITAGYTDSTFRPTLNISRGQFSAFLARALEVEFKQKASIENSFAKDKTKHYTFKSQQGGLEDLIYKDVGYIFGKDSDYVGYVWETTNQTSGEAIYLIEDESYQGLISAYPMSEYYVELIYPIKLGSKWESYMDTGEITGVDKIVTTPFKTFTQAVEVTLGGGAKVYYVKGVGKVKVLDAKGETIYELINIR